MKINNPLVSIIIPTFNRAELLPETLDSILAQTYQNWECIIVDDGSTDNTTQIIEKFSRQDQRISYHKRPETYRSGGNGARNYGLDISNGKYIYWFDSDDLMHEENLELHIQSLAGTELPFSICKVAHLKDGKFISRAQNINASSSLLDSYLTGQFSVTTCSILFNKKILNENNLRFNELLRAAQEWELFCRVFTIFNEYAAVDKELVYLRQHKNGMSTDPSIFHQRTYNYLLARKIAKKNLENMGKYSNEIDKIFQNFGYRYVPLLVRDKKFGLLNKFIFSTGITIENLYSFFSIYFLIITKRNKSKTKYI